jgi:hypothetical protein
MAVVVLSLAGLLAWRKAGIEPREWVGLCAAASPPLACLPRSALFWLQYWYSWGAAALVLGLLALRGAPFAMSVAAVAVGAAAVANYNATWGMLGLALGAWAWISNPPARPD